jgi:hypothetical protein
MAVYVVLLSPISVTRAFPRSRSDSNAHDLLSPTASYVQDPQILQFLSRS